MDIVERLKSYPPTANDIVDVIIEIERLRNNSFRFPALMDNLPHDTLMALHDHIHTIIDEREGKIISQSRKAKAKNARAALKGDE